MRKLALAAVLVLNGCASSQGIRPLLPYEIPTLAYRAGDATEQLGSLTYESGCLLFRPDDGGALLLPIWPDATRLEETMLTFHEPGKSDERLVTGQEVVLDLIPLDWASLDPERFARFHRQCDYQAVFVTGVAPAN